METVNGYELCLLSAEMLKGSGDANTGASKVIFLQGISVLRHLQH